MTQKSPFEAKKWYQKQWVIIAFIVFFMPVGVVLMWLYSGWGKKTKWILTGIATLLFFIAQADSSAKTTGEIAQTTESQSMVTAQDASKSAESKTVEPSPTPTIDTYLVTRVIDGDTIEIEGGQRIRYIGINTPETVDPSRPIQCYGEEASNKNKEYVQGKQVVLEKDVSETDKYGRLLRYVWVDGVMINDQLVRQGYAQASSYPPDVKHQDQFNEAQKEAFANNRGLWATCQNKTVSATPKPVTQTTTTPSQTTDSCTIKGNISSSGEKIFHVLGCQSYSKTKIDTSAGEKWFCSESEAIQAGWRKAKNC